MGRTTERKVSDILRDELHALAQPMAVLQCRLELGLMAGGEQPCRESLSGGLGDLRQITEALQRLREIAVRLASEEQG